MKIDLAKINTEQFMVHQHIVDGEVLHLVQPQHISAKWTQENKIFRSSVWNNDGELVSASFPKFVNFGEAPEVFPLPSSLNKTTIVEKIDGCCDENTMLSTTDGLMTIKEVCETKYNGKVLALDHNTNKEVMMKILSHSISQRKDNWYELTMVNGATIQLTGNHRVWLPELQCYRRVDELNGDEDVLLKK